MMNEEVYERIEKELEKNHINEDVDDVLLELAEAIQEDGSENKKTVSVKYGRVVVQASGHCEPDEEDEEELYVWMDELVIGKSRIVIEDYVM